MMIKKLLCAASLILTVGIMSAQVCGHVATQTDIDRLLKNKEAFNSGSVTKSIVTSYVPVTFHIVRKSDGSKGITEDKVLEQLCSLNEDYADQDVVFYLKDGTFNYINSTFLYETPANDAVSNKILEGKLGPGKNSMNIFICESAESGSQLGGVTLGYYSPFLDVIVMKQSEVNGVSATLAHEAGHFFSLMHPHNGWDQVAWDAGDHGIPLTSSTAPGGVLAELADGSNCENAGDFLCDTPADYNLGFGWPGCTNYTGGCQDVTGALLDPQEINFMGYFNGCSSYIFTDDQKNMVMADYESAGRSYIRVGYTPNEAVLQQTTLNTPIGGETTAGYNEVFIDWAEVDNAIGYFVELRTGITKTYYLVEASEMTLTSLASNKLYNWKVMPYTELGSCVGYTAGETFRTGLNTSLKEFENIDLNVYPTVINDGAFTISTSESFDADLKIVNIAGQVVSTTSQNLAKGANSLQISSELAKGIYFLNIQSEGRNSVHKLMVQ